MRESIFKGEMAENFLELMRGMSQVPDRINQTKSTRHIVIKMQNISLK